MVTSEPAAAGPGRTYVAAAHVPLLALRPGAEGPGPGAIAAATLGLTKSQALRLIAAESFARKVTLLPGAEGWRRGSGTWRISPTSLRAPADRGAARSRRDRRAASPGELAEQVRDLVDEEAALLGAEDREALVARVLRDTVGLGPLEDLLADPAVEEVMVNGPRQVYVERGGRIEATDAASPTRRSCATRSSGSSPRSAAGSTS